MERVLETMKMSQIRWKPELSLGSIMTIITMIVGITISHVRLEGMAENAIRKADQAHERILELEKADREIRAQITANDREFVRTFTRVETLLGGISSDISRLSRAVERGQEEKKLP